MSSELAIGIAGVVAAITIGAAQIWQGRRRRHTAPATPPPAQLRDEAMTGLIEASMIADQLGSGGSRWLVRARGLAKLDAHRRELVTLGARMRIAPGISPEETLAFTEATETFAAFLEGPLALRDKMIQRGNKETTSDEVAAAERMVQQIRGDLQITVTRFEEVARAAAGCEPMI